MTSTKIFFDLDGTVFDLYGKKNWLKSIETETAGLFTEWGDNNGFLSKIDQYDLKKYANELINKGYTFAVITWLPMGCSPEYAEICRREKIEWVRKSMPFVDEISVMPYGVPKQYGIVTKADKMILLDDNAEIMQMWVNNDNRDGYLISDDYGETVIDALMNELDIELGK